MECAASPSDVARALPSVGRVLSPAQPVCTGEQTPAVVFPGPEAVHWPAGTTGWAGKAKEINERLGFGKQLNQVSRQVLVVGRVLLGLGERRGEKGLPWGRLDVLHPFGPES